MDDDRNEACEPDRWPLIKAGVRAVAASFPGFATVAQVWNEYESYTSRERVEEWASNVREELEGLRKTVADLDERLDSVKNEFPALAETTVQCVRHEPGKERRRAFARAMLRLMVLECSVGLGEKLALIRELDALTDTDLRVLGVFADGRGHDLSRESWRSHGFARTEQERINVLYGPLCKLESRGLLAGTAPPGGVSFPGDDGIPKNWSWFSRIMWAMPRGLCLLRVVAEDEGQ